MPARSQTIYYPARTRAEVCKACYAAGQSSACQPANGSAQNSLTTCGNCNITCNSSQAYCSIGRQSVPQHGDISSNPWSWPACVAANEIIFRGWTAASWNLLGNNLQTAFNLGEERKQENGVIPAITSKTADPTNIPHPANSLITAEKYNQVADAISRLGQAIPRVRGIATQGPGGPLPDGYGDAIKEEHATNITSGYQGATFNSSVCDICNGAASQHNCVYNCSCNYNCSHNCNYNCSYNCSYDCSPCSPEP